MTNASNHPRDSLQLPSEGWKMIEKGNTSSLMFCHGHVITYFVDRQTCDGMPASDAMRMLMPSQKEGIYKE